MLANGIRRRGSCGRRSSFFAESCRWRARWRKRTILTSLHKAIDNGLIHAEEYLPDATNGFYRGTRFDRSGIIGELKYEGHDFYGPWFDEFEPDTHDYVVKDGKVVVGLASGSMGPTEEFNTPLGYDEAPVGSTFVKIGVGVLRKPDAAKYDHYRAYEIVDGTRWKVKSTATSMEFEQRVMDKQMGLRLRLSQDDSPDPQPAANGDRTLAEKYRHEANRYERLRPQFPGARQATIRAGFSYSPSVYDSA
jgi:hypothetical protein